jgi:hypothetical protein
VEQDKNDVRATILLRPYQKYKVCWLQTHVPSCKEREIPANNSSVVLVLLSLPRCRDHLAVMVW